MAEVQDKKWFVYFGDHHEGPFSVDEIQTKMRQGRVSSETYVWSEGMIDWQIMKDVGVFGGLLAPARASTESRQNAAVLLKANAATLQAEGEAEVKSERAPGPPRGTRRVEPEVRKHKSRLGRLKRPVLATAVAIAAGLGLLTPIARFSDFKVAFQRIADTTLPVQAWLVEKLPPLQGWLSPIAKPGDITRTDFERLRAAAAASIRDSGPKVALALAQSDPLSPVFYVASNLPDGTRFDVSVDGIPDTLLNQLGVEARGSVSVSHRLAKSDPVRMPDGRPLPRGEYWVSAIASGEESDGASDRRSVARQQYFLGGPKDQVYEDRLREFHEKLRQKAVEELIDVKQYTLTLETQLNQTVAKYRDMKRSKARPPLKRRMWENFDGQWSRLEGQLDKTFRQWTPDVTRNDFFFGKLFEMTQQAGSQVDKLHQLQNSFFSGSANAMALDNEVGRAVSVAQSAILALKSKIEFAEKIPPSPTGMPRKEGL